MADKTMVSVPLSALQKILRFDNVACCECSVDHLLAATHCVPGGFVYERYCLKHAPEGAQPFKDLELARVQKLNDAIEQARTRQAPASDVDDAWLELQAGICEERVETYSGRGLMGNCDRIDLEDNRKFWSVFRELLAWRRGER